MKNPNRFYVYMYFRPNGFPCYVGKGSGLRWAKHEWRSTNPHLASIIKQAGGKLPRIKVRENITETEAFALEKELIRLFKRESDGGILVNLTDGGEGLSGRIINYGTAKKVGKIHIGNTYRLGMKASPETKELQRKAKLGKSLSPEHRAKLAEKASARKGIPRDPEIGKKISATKTGKKATEETKAALRAANRSRDPEVRAKISEATRRGMAEAKARKLNPGGSHGY